MIVDRGSFYAVLLRLLKEPELGLDSETTGLRMFHGDRLFSLILSTQFESYYFNFNIYENLRDNFILESTHLEQLAPLFNDPARTWFIHKAANFDLPVLFQEKIDIKGTIHCTLAIARVEYNAHPSYNLAACLERIGGSKSDEVEKYIKEHKLYEKVSVPGKKQRVERQFYHRVPYDVIVPYGEQDGLGVFKLGKWQEKRLHYLDSLQPELVASGRTLTNVMNNERRLQKTVFRMKSRGVLIDRPYCDRAIIFERDREEKATRAFKRETGRDYSESPNLFRDVFGSQADQWTYTDKGNPSFDADALKRLGHPAAGHILELRDAKAKQNFYQGFLYHSTKEGILHPNFNPEGTVHGRFCLAKGTKIDIVRDVSKSPKGINIEDVQVGDYAYSYDKDKNLTLKRVLWAGKTGHKKIIRLHWAGAGGKTRGFLDLTPEHLVRLTDGSYRQAAKLTRGNRLLSLGRSKTLGYARLHSRDKEIREHRLIFEKVHGLTPEHVHHKDGNKLNNALSNLEGLSANQHISQHMRIRSNTPEHKLKAGLIFKKAYAQGRIPRRSGPESPTYKSIGRFQLLKSLAKTKGCPALVKGPLNDFSTVLKKCRELQIDIKEVKLRYGEKGYISRGKLKKSFDIVGQKNRLKFLGVNYYKFHVLCGKYGLKYSNHWVSRVELLDQAVDVYDLEIEDTHNFIANEICVHNSSSEPNFQNLTNEEDEGPQEFNVRRAIIPRPGYILIMPDYSQMEYKFMLEMACRLLGQATELSKLISGGMDFHEATGQNVWLVTGMEVPRKQIKIVNFMTLYGSGVQNIADTLKVTYEQALKIQRAILDSAPEIKNYMAALKKTAEERGYIVNWMGRRCHFPFKSMSYKAPNYHVSGGSADVNKLAMNQVDEYLLVKKSHMIMTVHDELPVEVHESEISQAPQRIVEIMEKAFPSKYVPLTVSMAWSDKSLGDKIKGYP